MKFLPSSWQTTDMIVRTFFTNVGIINRVVFELPQHEEVNKDTSMRIIEKHGKFYVIAETLAKPQGTSERKVTSALAENKN
jgi:hypothetical protein